MGYLPNMPPDCGPYSVEIRRESFYLRGEDCYEAERGNGEYPEHVIYTYGDRAGTIEILTADIPHVMACLRLVAEREGIDLTGGSAATESEPS